MEEFSSQPDSPAATGGPLQMASPDRVNQRRDTLFATLRAQGAAAAAAAAAAAGGGGGGRDSTVHDKISQFNNLSMSMQSRQLERKTADAALKRAMVGREEAEAEMRRLKEEGRVLRQDIEEGKERERRVGERLETVMENYGRAKETHAHTQALWEKEIRRARKENFKAQSTIVKLQEDIKATRAATKLVEESLQHEKERSRAREQESSKAQSAVVQLQEDMKAARAATKLVEESLQQEKERGRAQEQEAFEAKYQISSLQEQLDQALERIKLVEQERDAYKIAAKNEEVARLAAEGRIPLPADESDDEFASPPRKRRIGSTIRCKDPRVSLSTMEVVSSAVSELEIEQLTEQVQWERQRADRAQEMVEFMQAECQMNCCPCSKSKRRTSMLAMQQLPRASPEKPRLSMGGSVQQEKGAPPSEHLRSPVQQQELKLGKVRKGARRSTIFCPKEGVFRTVSEQEAIELEAQRKAEIVIEAHEEAEPELPSPAQKQEAYQRTSARTPSAEPSAYGFAHGRSSLMSLINAPRIDAQADSLPNLRSIPTAPDYEPAQEGVMRYQAAAAEEEEDLKPLPAPGREQEQERFSLPRKRPSADSRPSSRAAVYTVTTTTTVPVRDERSSSSSFSQRMRTASSSSSASFDMSDPAMTPTMTREEALAKIRERRGRARSATRGAATPQSRPTSGLGRRDMSGSMGRVGSRSRNS
ncbi:pap2 superfamily [Trichoderma cornu-damae]|uniref:Pap2 superfamily n=1 Tax=Trichoderma cornu-damae TaxID=654480 RepID=A0A9P8QK88_9HYPO|nr:pap2 superfamily [Trichoderma cornu-damae]